MHTRRLTAAEQARILEFREKWIRIGLSTTPLDHQRAEGALRRLYAASGLARPSIVWAPCPMTALLSAIVYTRIRNTRQEKRAGNDGALARIIDRSTGDALNRTVPASAHRPMQLAVERAVAAALGR